MRKFNFVERAIRKPFNLKFMIVILLIGFSGMFAIAATTQPSDTAIARAVEDELFLDMANVSYQIDITANDGVVTLSGSVDNLLAKEKAARITRVVKGVRAVVDKIQVAPQFCVQRVRSNNLKPLGPW